MSMTIRGLQETLQASDFFGRIEPKQKRSVRMYRSQNKHLKPY